MVTTIPALVGIKTAPEAITLRITCPRTTQLSAFKQKELEEKLEGHFFLVARMHAGIITLHLDAIGNPDRFHERLEWLIGEIRTDISSELRFSVEVEY